MGMAVATTTFVDFATALGRPLRRRVAERGRAPTLVDETPEEAWRRIDGAFARDPGIRDFTHSPDTEILVEPPAPSGTDGDAPRPAPSFADAVADVARAHSATVVRGTHVLFVVLADVVLAMEDYFREVATLVAVKRADPGDGCLGIAEWVRSSTGECYLDDDGVDLHASGGVGGVEEMTSLIRDVLSSSAAGGAGSFRFTVRASVPAWVAVIPEGGPVVSPSSRDLLLVDLVLGHYDPKGYAWQYTDEGAYCFRSSYEPVPVEVDVHVEARERPDPASAVERLRSWCASRGRSRVGRRSRGLSSGGTVRKAAHDQRASLGGHRPRSPQGRSGSLMVCWTVAADASGMARAEARTLRPFKEKVGTLAPVPA